MSGMSEPMNTKSGRKFTKKVNGSHQTLLKFQLDKTVFRSMMSMPESSMIVDARLRYDGILEFIVQDMNEPDLPGKALVETRPTIDEQGNWSWNVKA